MSSLERKCPGTGKCDGTSHPRGRGNRRRCRSPVAERWHGPGTGGGAGRVPPSTFSARIVVGNGTLSDRQDRGQGERESHACREGIGHQHPHVAKQTARVSRHGLPSASGKVL